MFGSKEIYIQAFTQLITKLGERGKIDLRCGSGDYMEVISWGAVYYGIHA